MSERVSNEQALADSRIGRGKGRPFKFNDDRPGLRAYALDLLDARRERDEAHETIAWITGTDDVESVIAGAMAALAAKGGGDGESRLERIRRLIEEQYIECPTGCGASFEELLCYELHDGGLTFRALAQKWNIGLPTLGSLIADHCKRL